MRLVLDTDVMVAALRSACSASRRLLVAVLDRRVDLLVSVPLMIEYEAVLTRPEHLQASALSAADVGDVLDAVAMVLVRVRLRCLWRPQLKDPTDEMVLETAVNGGAEGLVTFNVRHLAALDLRQVGHIGVLVAADLEALPGRFNGRLFGCESRETGPGTRLIAYRQRRKARQ